MRLFLLLLISTALAGSAPSAAMAHSACPFSYDRAYQDRVVAVLKKEYGKAWHYFNYGRPGIEMNGDLVEVNLIASESYNGKSASYEGVFVITFDACTREIVKTRELMGVK